MRRVPPRLAGRALTAARAAAEAPATSLAVRAIFRRALGLDELERLPDWWRGELPLDARPVCAKPDRPRPSGSLPLPEPRAWPRSSASYVAAYRARETTPSRVAERALEELRSLAARTPSMNVLACHDRDATLRDAERSTARWAAGAPLGPLDGVPFLVKDELDVAGLPTRLGSRCGSDLPARSDSTVVARLRAAGAVFVGKTVLTEWGMSPIGANASASMPRNAFHAARAPGGSSTGTGVGIALGAAPIGAGGDGGGSIRTPAALNGIFGIKPTFGRVSRAGDGFKGSVAHAGPLASSAVDLALFLDAVASERDDADPLTAWAPPPPEGGFAASLGAGVSGLRIGVDDDEWADASPVVAKAGREALAGLEREGARLVPIKTSLVHHAAKIGYLTIGPESLAAHRGDWLERRHLMNDDLRLAFAVLSGFSALEQLDAQRLRAGLRREMAALLADLDLIALPTTAITAPRYDDDDARGSFSDPAALDGLCRFAFLANLTGLPAATAPVGADADGLPIGLQLVGDAWDEATVLAALAHLERTGIASVRRPPGAVDLLA